MLKRTTNSRLKKSVGNFMAAVADLRMSYMEQRETRARQDAQQRAKPFVSARRPAARMTAVALAACMMLTLMPNTAFATMGDNGEDISTDSACTHHIHDDACGLEEIAEGAVPAHTHTQTCYALSCVHTVHGEACGYMEETAGADCTFICAQCAAEDEANGVEAKMNPDCPLCTAEGTDLSAAYKGEAPKQVPLLMASSGGTVISADELVTALGGPTYATVSGNTVTLIQDVTLSDTITVSEGDITLDLGGKFITGAAGKEVISITGGKLTVSGDGKITSGEGATAGAGIAVDNSGNLTVTGGTITGGDGGDGGVGISALSGSVTVTGGIITGGAGTNQGSPGNPGIAVTNGSLIVSGGTIIGSNGNAGGVGPGVLGDVTITGGTPTFTGGMGVDGNVTINGGAPVFTGIRGVRGIGGHGVAGNVTINGGTPVFTGGSDTTIGKGVNGTITLGQGVHLAVIESDDNSNFATAKLENGVYKPAMQYVKVTEPLTPAEKLAVALGGDAYATASGTTVTLLQNVTLSDTITVTEGDIILDLSIFAITGEAGVTPLSVSGCKLTVSGDGKITGGGSNRTGGNGVVVDSVGSLTVTGGAITGGKGGTGGGSGIRAGSGGSVTVSGGVITGGEGTTTGGIGIYVFRGSLTASGGTITGGVGKSTNGNGVSVFAGNVTITGGTPAFIGGTGGVSGNGGIGIAGDVTINGGTPTFTGGTGAASGTGGHGVAGDVTINGGTPVFTGGSGTTIGNGVFGSVSIGNGVHLAVVESDDDSNFATAKLENDVYKPTKRYVKVADPDIAIVTAAKAAAEGADYADTTQAATGTEEAAKSYVKGIAETAVNNSGVTVVVKRASYTAPAAGTSATPEGTNGSYVFTVTVSKGKQSRTTAEQTLTITATAYTGVTDAQAVAAAKTAVVDGAVDVAFGATQADKTAAVQSYVDALLTGDAAGVTATVTYNSGKYDVAFTKGSVKDSKTIAMTVNVAPNPDIAIVTAAKTAVEGADYADTTQAATGTEEAAESYVKGIAETAVNNSGVTVEVKRASYTAPVAGTSATPEGTNGSYVFTVTVSKGEQSRTTAKQTLTITATAYYGVTDAQAVAAAKTAVVDGTVDVAFGATQPDKTTAVQSYVDALLTGDAAGVTAAVTHTNGDSYTVTLTKGNVSESKAITMKTNEAPDPDIALVAKAKELAKTALDNMTVTNDTTAANILDAVTAAIAPANGVTALWKNGSPTITQATIDRAGSMTGTILLTHGNEVVEIKVDKTIEKLPKPTPEKLTIAIGGNGSNHEINSGKDLTLTCSGKLDDLTGIYVDGSLVDASYYTLSSGSTVLTLKSGYLDTLSVGTHTLKFQYKDDASAEINFTITEKGSDTPPTGDSGNAMALFILLLASGGAVTALLATRRKTNGQDSE